MQVQRVNSTYYNTNFGRILVNNVPKKVNNMKRVVILSGPSGVGKDTVLSAFIESTKKIANKPLAQKVVTSTTRAARPGEVNGIHYYFKTPEECHSFAELLDYAKQHGYKKGWAYFQAKKRGILV